MKPPLKSLDENNGYNLLYIYDTLVIETFEYEISLKVQIKRPFC